MINVFQIVSDKTWGGPEQYAHDLISRLKRDDFYVEAVCRKHESVLNRFRTLEVPISILPLKGLTDLDSPVRFARLLKRGDNVVLVGSPGVGKTHLSVAIGYEAVMARKQVYFADCSRLVEDLKHASSKDALPRRMRFYEHCSLLIVDELGYLDIGKEGADLLFQLVNRRYALKRSTIVTTNVPVGRWGDVFGSNVTASAIADRLCHHCALIKITGRSYRLKDVSLGGDDGKEGKD